ncbi:hypothetical protein [Roseibium algae]|uniref:Uncharacterized protein n=1 Tax=Roseibium algae TaxID=3123038 RepID=A0ABU8TM67_9HYPH
MKTHFRRSASALAIGLFIANAAGSLPARAFEPSGNDVADAFLNLLEAQEGTVESYSAVNTSGDTVTIEGIKLTDEGADNLRVTIARTDLTNAETVSGGLMKVGEMALSGLNMTADDGSLSIASFSSTDLVLPTAAELTGSDDVPPMAPSYGELEILGTVIQDEDGNQATASRIFIAIDEMDGDLPTASRFAIDGLLIDPESLDNDGKKTLSDLGYEQINISIAGSGKWVPEAATVNVDDLEITADDAGTVKMSFMLGGVTRDVVNELNKTQGEPEDALGLIQGITVNSISLAVDNDSLIERILDMQAKEIGTDRAGMVAQLQGGLPMMLSLLQNPEFQTKVATALGSFLKNPVSLNLVATPAAPVPVAQIMGTAMMAPQTLPQVLGLDITANSGE